MEDLISKPKQRRRRRRRSMNLAWKSKGMGPRWRQRTGMNLMKKMMRKMRKRVMRRMRKKEKRMIHPM